MKVPDEVRKCVAFVYIKDTNGMRAIGTCFFVAMRSKQHPKSGYSYTVTAKHVLDAIRDYSVDQVAWLRVNWIEGGARLTSVPRKLWFTHPTDETVDAAVVPWAPLRPHGFDTLLYPLESRATADSMAQEGTGIGEEVFITGLFVNHAGRQRNEPIVRVGALAAMPAERVATRLGDAHVYLVELRSIGGLSGSPAFLHLGAIRMRKGAVTVARGTSEDAGHYFLLGVVQGHWRVSVGASTTQTEAVNMGLGIVTPIERVTEILDQPELSTLRDLGDDEKEKAKEESLPVMDTVPALVEDRVSLAPLDPEQALRALLATPKNKD